MQQHVEHHQQVSRQVDDGGVDEQGYEEDEQGVEDVALQGLQHGHGGHHRVVEVAVADVVGELLPQRRDHGDFGFNVEAQFLHAGTVEDWKTGQKQVSDNSTEGGTSYCV